MFLKLYNAKLIFPRYFSALVNTVMLTQFSYSYNMQWVKSEKHQKKTQKTQDFYINACWSLKKESGKMSPLNTQHISFYLTFIEKPGRSWHVYRNQPFSCSELRCAGWIGSAYSKPNDWNLRTDTLLSTISVQFSPIRI